MLNLYLNLMVVPIYCLTILSQVFFPSGHPFKRDAPSLAEWRENADIAAYWFGGIVWATILSLIILII